MNVSRKKAIMSGSVVLVVLGAAVLEWGRPPAQPMEDPLAPAGLADFAKVPPKDWAAEVVALGREDGLRLARARGVAMKQLVRTDPERAIRQALSFADWDKLPPELKAHVEQPFSAVADIEVMVACGEGLSETAITTEIPGEGTLETHVYGRRNELGSKTGLPVQGIHIAGVAALREETFQLLVGEEEQAALAHFPVAQAGRGEGSVPALAGGRIFYFEDREALDEANRKLAQLEALPGPASGSKALFEAAGAYVLDDGTLDFPKLEAWSTAASTAWTGTPRDMYVIMVDFSDNSGQPADPVAFSNSLNTTVSQQIGEMSYGKTHIVATVNPATYRMPLPSSSYTNNASLLYTDAVDLAEAAGNDLSAYETVCVLFPKVDGISWAGLASIGGIRLRLNGTTSPDVVIHELGHNYGAWHASSWEVPGNDPVDPAGSALEYGDFLDIMGSGDAPEGHFNAWHKRHIGWFDANNWQSVSNSGTYRVYRFDHSGTTALLRGLEIEKRDGDQYWVGLRQQYPAYEEYARGGYIVWKKAGNSRSFLIDTRPQSAGGVFDGGIALGQTYSDPAAGVHITPVARGGQAPNEWMDFTVNLGSFPGNSAPTASISGTTSMGVNQSAVFSVSASDADGDGLAYYWDTGDGLVKPNAPSIPVAFVSGGTATVSCVVSDMKGGTNRVSQTVVVSSPLENWTKRTSGTTAQLNDIACGNGRLVAVGRDWKVVYSDDGTNWTVFTFGYPYAPYFEGVLFDGSQFVAVGLDYDGAAWGAGIYTSDDGANWTRRHTGGSALNDVAYGAGKYVAVGDNGTIARSTDGTSWSAVASGTTIDLSGVSFGDGTFVAVGSAPGGGPATVLTSPDGLSWADHSSGVDLASWKGLSDVEFFNDRFLAGGWHAKILHSIDQGQTFTTSMTGNGLIIPAFAYGGGTYFAAGLEKVYSGSWMTFDINLVSLDGENWTPLATPSQDDRNAAVYFNGTFVTVGDNGSIWQSDPVVAGDGGFAAWQLENAAALGLNRDPLDDADFDGHLNLAEYALGTTATDAGSLPDASIAATGNYFQVTFDRNGIKPDIDYTPERATNLASNDWNSAGTAMVEDSASNLTVRSAFPISGQTNEYMRLNLELK